MKASISIWYIFMSNIYVIRLIFWYILLDVLCCDQSKVWSCEVCRGVLSPMAGPPGEVGQMEEESPAVTRLQQTVRELELELAQTKLALVESECKNQVKFFPCTCTIQMPFEVKSRYLNSVMRMENIGNPVICLFKKFSVM